MTGDNNQQVFLSNVASVGYYGEKKERGNRRGDFAKEGEIDASWLTDINTHSLSLFIELGWY